MFTREILDLCQNSLPSRAPQGFVVSLQWSYPIQPATPDPHEK